MLARYRSAAVPLAVVAAVVLFYMVNPWFYPAVGSTERGMASVAFWILMIGVLVLLFEDRKAPLLSRSRLKVPTSRTTCSAIPGLGSSGCRSACSSASNG